MLTPRPYKVLTAFQAKQAYTFSSVQFNFPSTISSEIIRWGKENIPDTILKASPGDPPGFTGRENEIHVTIKYGIHIIDSTAIQNILKNQEPFKIVLGDISLFEQDDLDVVKIDIQQTPELMALNDLISRSFEITDKFPDYLPHCTVAYVKKGEGKKYIGNKYFNGKTILVDSVCFSGKDNRYTILNFKKSYVDDRGVKRPITIGIDFDGTLVELNKDIEDTNFVLKPHAKEVVDWMRENNFYLILWTVRCGNLLQNALNFLNEVDVRLDMVNDNAPWFKYPTSKKIFWDFCVDDHAILEDNLDWIKVKNFLQKKFLEK